jgi:hypothetical protein
MYNIQMSTCKWDGLFRELFAGADPELSKVLDASMHTKFVRSIVTVKQKVLKN